MKILNTTTGEIEQLIHSGYDCDCVPDLIASDSTITWHEDGEIRQGDEDSVAWWRTYLAADAEYMEAKAQLVETLDYDEKDDLETLLNAAMSCDMDDQPAAGMSVIAEWIANEKEEES